jgi:signal transduction histidine kinase
MAYLNNLPNRGAAGLPSADADGTTSFTALCDHLAQVIHDRVLQSLALSMLQADLCRRGILAGDQETALAELSGIEPELQAAVDTLRGVIRDLQAAAHANTSGG